MCMFLLIIEEISIAMWSEAITDHFYTYHRNMSSIMDLYSLTQIRHIHGTIIMCTQRQTEPSIHIFISNMTLIAILYALTLSNISNFTVIIACQAKGHSLMGLFELLLTSVL